jgi:CRISPR-associated protein Cmr5
MGEENVINRRQDLSQRRAAKAWEYVKIEHGKDYGSLTQRLTQMVQINGLVATAAFLYSKRDKAHFALLYDQLSGWICIEVYDGGGDLLEQIRSRSSVDLRRATAEAITFSIWLRRFSEAVFGDVRSDQED